MPPNKKPKINKTPNADRIRGNIFRDLKRDPETPQFKLVAHNIPKKEFRPNTNKSEHS